MQMLAFIFQVTRKHPLQPTKGKSFDEISEDRKYIKIPRIIYPQVFVAIVDISLLYPGAH